MTTDSGVSPVIGVLLMLTLTLIIAAIVNSFAGGLVDTKKNLLRLLCRPLFIKIALLIPTMPVF
jgi:flagellin-like protein